ncbi:MAG: InlB B-repeat-containing protein [Clostridiales Family XIII bacterium]|nr:InlB B-repeat-containing protein [Clostridiales Family XIII bacterium]
MTLYAKWTIGGFTASFDMKGHGSPAPAPQSVVFGARIAEPAQPSETGCIFGGWYTDAACSPGAEWDFDTDTMPGHDQTLYAKWSFIPYKVYFSLNGHGAPAPAAMTVQYGGKIPTPTQPSDKGWTFGGWFTDAACSPGAEWDFATSTMPLSDLTLYAKWTEKIGGGSGSNDDKDKDEDNDKDNDSDSGKDSGKSKDNSGSGSSGGDNAGGSGANTGGATGDGTGGIADGGIGGVSGDGDAYGENGADNIGGDESEWHTNGGNAAAGEDDNGRGSQEDMSFANILLMAAGIAIAVFMALNARRRRYQRWLLPVVVALGALGAILYLAIEGIHGAWALINSHTIYFAIILAAQIAATIIARRS